MEWLKSLVIDGAMECAVDLSMRAEMPSKPFALDVSSDCSTVRMTMPQYSPFSWLYIASFG